MLKKKNILSLCFLWLFSSALFAQCPTIITGNPGNPNRTVVFYGGNGEVVATCNCQLSGNNLKCGNDKPADDQYFYFEVTYQSQTVICYSNTTLGVELQNYGASYVNGIVQCFWSTVFEENNSHFYWQKSTDGVVTWDLDTITGKGTITGLNNYRFSDLDPMREWAYYRMVQVDFDGHQTIYPWIYVYKDQMESHSLRLIPNPSQGDFTFFLPYQWDQAELRVINIAGQEMCRFQVRKGSENIHTDLTPGRYTVQVRSDRGCEYGTIIIRP